MFKLDIKISKTDFRRVRSAMTRQITFAQREKNDLPYRCAVSFKDLVFSKILAGDFNHPAYNPDYAKFKKRYGDKGPWRLHDNLLQSLTAFKTADGWMGGIPDGAPVIRISGKPGGRNNRSIKIAHYAKLLEYGLDIQKKRPVFVPTTDEFENSGFPEEVNKSAAMLRNAWR